ncbi:MAG: hypothetical protein GX162_02820 [Firmicutes bacterium]|nr:hypothetical protein [Bacillota bacterium]
MLLSNDEAQRWLGALEISADPTRNRYVLCGVLPNRSLLTTIKRRLQSIEDAEVDSDAVRIDPRLEPDFRRLPAISRQAARTRQFY